MYRIGFKPIPNFPDYAATKTGRIWSRRRERAKGGWLKPHKDKQGYLHVVLCKQSKPHTRKNHRLVLETFVGPCPKGMQCRHLDGNPANNCLDNLQWGTQSEDVKDRMEHGRIPKGKTHHYAKFTEQDARMIIYIHRTGLFNQQEIAKIYKVSPVTINLIVNKKSWKHIWRI